MENGVVLSSVDALAEQLYGQVTDETRDAVLAAIGTVGGLKTTDVTKAMKFVTEQESDNGHQQMTLEVPGDPPISKRPRASRIKNGSGQVVGIRVHAADAAEQRSMRSEITLRIPEGYVPFAGEVEIHLGIYRPMLSGWPQYKRLLAELGYVRPESKPDFDNFAKILIDAMRGVVFVDDGQIVVGNVSLNYSVRPRLEVTVSGRPRRMNK